MAGLTTLNGTETLNLFSYNCRGYNASKINYIVNLLDKFDVFFLQEHWLADPQLDTFNHVSPYFLASGVSGFSPTDVLTGRPYEGCSILWRRTLGLELKRLSLIVGECALFASVTLSFHYFLLM